MKVAKLHFTNNEIAKAINICNSKGVEEIHVVEINSSKQFFVDIDDCAFQMEKHNLDEMYTIKLNDFIKNFDEKKHNSDLEKRAEEKAKGLHLRGDYKHAAQTREDRPKHYKSKAALTKYINEKAKQDEAYNELDQSLSLNDLIVEVEKIEK